MENSSPFTWSSTLGISVILFLLMNFIYFLMGVISPVVSRIFEKDLSIKFGLVFSPRSDSAAFGKPTADVLKEHPSANVIKTSVYDMFAGLYLAFAIAHFCLVWFGLMRGEQWSFWALTGSNLAIIIFYLIAVKNFSNNVTPLHFGDLMPFAYVPAMILPFASILGYIGLQGK